MADNSKIEWTDASWNPIRARNKENGKVGWHCEHSTTGCEFCYSEGFNLRLGTGLPYKPGHRKDVELFLDEKTLLEPLRWRRARMIFVCSMTDLFADFVEAAWLDKVFAVMALCPQHTFQVLTKRSARMRLYLSAKRPMCWLGPSLEILKSFPDREAEINDGPALPNVWMGVSCERQAEVELRVPDLLKCPAAVRFVSAEPLLVGLDFRAVAISKPDESTVYRTINALTGVRGHGGKFGLTETCDPVQPKLDWIIVGGESGREARPFHVEWADRIVGQCREAGVACFVKQLGRNPFAGGRRLDLGHGKGGDPSEWPERLRVRQLPELGGTADRHLAQPSLFFKE